MGERLPHAGAQEETASSVEAVVSHLVQAGIVLDQLMRRTSTLLDGASASGPASLDDGPAAKGTPLASAPGSPPERLSGSSPPNHPLVAPVPAHSSFAGVTVHDADASWPDTPREAAPVALAWASP